jgi:hypothetical protein
MQQGDRAVEVAADLGGARHAEVHGPDVMVALAVLLAQYGPGSKEEHEGAEKSRCAHDGLQSWQRTPLA